MLTCHPLTEWLTETNSCVDAGCAGHGKFRCPTTFVGPNNMASSFNRSSWRAKGDVVSTDMRALNNQLWTKPGELGYRAGAETAEPGTTGLTGFGPNINVVKDPRYGRNSELPGEDPVLTAECEYLSPLASNTSQLCLGMHDDEPVLYLAQTRRRTFRECSRSRPGKLANQF